MRLGRLGGLSVAARGRTNVAPARAAWEHALAAEFGITDDLAPGDRHRRMQAAMRVRMSRLARIRWAAKGRAPIVTPGSASDGGGNDDARPSTG